MTMHYIAMAANWTSLFFFCPFFCVSLHCTACGALLGIAWITQMTDTRSENSLNHHQLNQITKYCAQLIESCQCLPKLTRNLGFDSSFKVVFNFSTTNKSGFHRNISIHFKAWLREKYKARLHRISLGRDDPLKRLKRSPSWQYWARKHLVGCKC